MSIVPDSRLASIAAVFSIARTVICRNRGAGPGQCGFGSSRICEPETNSPNLPRVMPTAGSVTTVISRSFRTAC